MYTIVQVSMAINYLISLDWFLIVAGISDNLIDLKTILIDLKKKHDFTTVLNLFKVYFEV